MTIEEGLDPFNNPSRVVASDGAIQGVVWFEDYLRLSEEVGPDTVRDVMESLEPNQFLSSETSILDVVNIFGRTSNRVVPIVSFFWREPSALVPLRPQT